MLTTGWVAYWSITLRKALDTPRVAEPERVLEVFD